MVRDLVDGLAVQRAQEAQSGSDKNSPVNLPLPLSPSSSLEHYYLDEYSEPQTVQSIPRPTSVLQKIANIDKMSRVTNPFTKVVQIKLQLNGPDNWVEWN